MFKRDTGETLVKYITDKTNGRRKEMLPQSDTPIYQVALQVGYDNYSYFTKAFKQKSASPQEITANNAKRPIKTRKNL